MKSFFLFNFIITLEKKKATSDIEKKLMSIVSDPKKDKKSYIEVRVAPLQIFITSLNISSLANFFKNESKEFDKYSSSDLKGEYKNLLKCLLKYGKVDDLVNEKKANKR